MFTVMKGFLSEYLMSLEPDVEFSEEEMQKFGEYLSQFDDMAHEMVSKLEPDRRDALCEQVLALGLFAMVQRDGMPPEVCAFVEMVFNRCNIRITDERDNE